MTLYFSKESADALSKNIETSQQCTLSETTRMCQLHDSVGVEHFQSILKVKAIEIVLIHQEQGNQYDFAALEFQLTQVAHYD